MANKFSIVFVYQKALIQTLHNNLYEFTAIENKFNR